VVRVLLDSKVQLVPEVQQVHLVVIKVLQDFRGQLDHLVVIKVKLELEVQQDHKELLVFKDIREILGLLDKLEFKAKQELEFKDKREREYKEHKEYKERQVLMVLQD
jgi:hypothetical protein